jgi:hypothetical protein
MEQQGNEVHATETEASGGSKEGVVRWVLIIGTLLAIILLTVVWTTGAFMQNDGADSETSVSNRIAVDKAAADDRGEPIAPPAVSPTATATPGDAPAGDPKPSGQ